MFKAALDSNNFGILSLMFDYMRPELKVAIETGIPEMIVKSLKLYEEPEYNDRYLTYKLVKKVIAKLDIDFNYHDCKNGCLLHNSIDLYIETTGNKKWLDKMFDLILKQDELELDIMYPSIINNHDNSKKLRIELSPLQYAIRRRQYNLAIKLILAGADCRNLNFEMFYSETGSNNILKLLYQMRFPLDINYMRSKSTTNLKAL